MDKTIIDILNEFSYELTKQEPVRLQDIELTLPYNLYRRLEQEVFQDPNLYFINVNIEEGLKFNTSTGTTIKVISSTLRDDLVKKKLGECYNILKSLK